jgi:hypothetical protein
MADSKNSSEPTRAGGQPSPQNSPDVVEEAGSVTGSNDDHDASNEFAPELKEAFVSELAKILDLGIEYGFNFSFDNFYEHTKVMFDRSHQVRLGLSKGDDFIKISEIEELISSLLNRHQELDMLDLMHDLQHKQGEKDLIIKKKVEYQSKGIILRVFRDYQTSVVTLFGRIHYTRKALIISPISRNNTTELLDRKKFIFPVDEALGVAHLPFKMTVSAMLEVAREACLSDSFEEAEQKLKQRTNIVINDDTIRKVTNTIGLLTYENDVKNAEEIWSSNPPWNFKRTSKNPINKHTLYLELDGAMVHTRESHEKRQTDNPDCTILPTSGINNEYNNELKDPLDQVEKASSWKENKLAMAFSTDNFLKWVDKHGVSQHRICKKEFTTLIGSAEDFKKHFYSLAVKNGYGNYKDTVLLSDGATWIRKMKDELFDNVIQILDFFHLCENVSTFAKNIYGTNDSNHQSWSRHICHIIKTNSYEVAIKEIQLLGRKKLLKSKFNLVQYIINNKNSINYKEYIARGFFIGSGAIESANRSVLQRRLKLPGMRWNVENGQTIVTLMAKVKSNLWEKDVANVAYNKYGVKLPCRQLRASPVGQR